MKRSESAPLREPVLRAVGSARLRMRNFRMKVAIALAAALVVATPFLAQSQEFVPLTTYVQQDIAKDPVALGYVAIRCSALYLVFSAMLQDEIGPERQQQRESFTQASLKFQEIALKAQMTGTTTALKDAGRDVGQTLTSVSLLYNDRIKRAKALNNNMFSDPLIAGDFNTCKTLLSHL